MRPDRIIVGEVRGEEAIDMLQAMNTGHDGGMTTIHANTPRDALARLETMIAMANLRISDKAMRQQICSAIHLIIQVSRLSDGARKVMSVSEVIGMEGEIITMQEIFRFVRTGVGMGVRFRGSSAPPASAPGSRSGSNSSAINCHRSSSRPRSRINRAAAGFNSR